MNDFNVVIIGAGVVGLACAEILSVKYDSVIVIEKHNSFGNETSSRNSEVIHAGMYYPENSLKAKLCVKGNNSIYEYCEKNNVPYNKCGKMIISIDESGDEKLNGIYHQGIKNGVEKLYYLDNEEVRNQESLIKFSKVLFSPNTGVVDSHKLMTSFKNNAEEKKCDFAFNHEVIGIRKENDYYRIFIKDKDGFDYEITTDILINAAGLNSDKIAESVGIDIKKNNYKLNYVRGNYFKLSSKFKNKIQHLIYPVPSDNYGIGIHVTLDLAGYLKLGPDTEFLEENIIDYSVKEILIDKFYKAGSSYIPDLKIEDLSVDQSGIRPKLQKRGEKFRDFVIQNEIGLGYKNFINLIGIESPGLTCSIEIAKMVDEIIQI